jgi:hypothetical protein
MERATALGCCRWLIEHSIEIRCIKYNQAQRTLIPVEVDVARAALHLLDRPDLSMIAYSGHIHLNALSNVYLFGLHHPLQSS